MHNYTHQTDESYINDGNGSCIKSVSAVYFQAFRQEKAAAPFPKTGFRKKFCKEAQTGKIKLYDVDLTVQEILIKVEKWKLTEIHLF